MTSYKTLTQRKFKGATCKAARFTGYTVTIKSNSLLFVKGPTAALAWKFAYYQFVTRHIQKALPCHPH
jgi:hypothetical protein